MQLDKNYTCGIIALDLCKAFDTVNHEILLDKMHDLGIRGIAPTWFRNYLSNRFQFVCLNNVMRALLKKISVAFPEVQYWPRLYF